MAADKEQAKKAGEKEEVVKEEKPKTINHNDHYSIKRVLDDAVSEVVLGRGYEENVNLSNVKMAIGLITCAIALAAQFYPKKFPENKTFLIGCIILYPFNLTYFVKTLYPCDISAFRVLSGSMFEVVYIFLTDYYLM
ncbi:hypothetical protein Mapa_008829 [Marchantia paleacea]|nr:hypothetical protein Mapa_008829 [Marchantia paleacea]